MAQLRSMIERDPAVEGPALLVAVLGDVASALERIATVAEGLALEEPSAAAAGCDHPAETREDSSVMGRERWICRAPAPGGGVCGYAVDRPRG